MKRVTSRVVIPFLAFCSIGLLLNLILWTCFAVEYRINSTNDVAAVIGAVVETYPEIDTVDIIEQLRTSSSNNDSVAKGKVILEKYGLLPNDYATPSVANLQKRYFFAMLCLTLAIVGAFTIYLIWVYYRQHRSVCQLVEYLQDISNHIYDLRPDDNDEGEFSLLTNELYKTTVVLKEAAETNRRHRLELSNTLADISHQLRTPMTSIQVMVDNIYDDPDMPLAVRQDFLLSISRQVNTMSKHITTLLHLARFDNGSIQLQPKKAKIDELLQSATEQLAILAELSDVELKITGDLDTSIRLDTHWQREALINIIKNCIEHSPQGGTVKIKVQKCPLYLRITIQDQGEGMTMQVQRHIFERFYKAPGSAKDGIGIGLAFAKAIIESEDGQVSVSSTPGEGATFLITYFH